MARKSRKETLCVKCNKYGHYQTECEHITTLADPPALEETPAPPKTKRRGRKSRKETLCAKCNKYGHYQTECKYISSDVVEEPQVTQTTKKPTKGKPTKRGRGRPRKGEERTESGPKYDPAELVKFIPTKKEWQAKVAETTTLVNEFNSKYSIGDKIPLSLDKRKNITTRTIALEKYGEAVVWFKGDGVCICLSELAW